MYCLTVLGALSTRSCFQQIMVSLKPQGEDTSLSLSLFWGLPAILGIPWLFRCINPVSASILTWLLCLCIMSSPHVRHPTPVRLPGKSHGWKSLVGCSPWGRKESDMTERLPFHFSLSCIGEGNGNPLQCSCLENPGKGEPGGLPSMGSHRVRHD